jgi:hypothetical protein
LASSNILSKEQEESGMHDYQGQGVILEVVVKNDSLSSVGGLWVDNLFVGQMIIFQGHDWVE